MNERKEIIVFFLLSGLLHLLIFVIPYISVKDEEGSEKLSQKPLLIEFVHQKPDKKPNLKARRLSYQDHFAKRETRKRETVAKLPSKGVEVKKEGEIDDGMGKVRERLFRGFENTGDMTLPEEDTVNLNTREFRYISYFAKLKSKIELVWNYPRISIIRGEQGTVKLKFTIRSDGVLQGIEVLESSGYPQLDDEAVRAVKIASPYPPFPKSWGLKRLHIIGEFNYILGYRLIR